MAGTANISEYIKAGGDIHSRANQTICGKLVAREVGPCVSSLISHFASNQDALSGSGYDWEEDILPLCEYPPDYEQAARDEGWEEMPDGDGYINRENTIDYYCADSEDWEELCFEYSIGYEGDDRDKEENISYGELADIQGSAEKAGREEGWEWVANEKRFVLPNITVVGDWEELCSCEGIEPEREEVYEHWIVSDWLADKLSALGHPTGELFGLTIWGRGGTGQAILLDYAIAAIAAEMLILDGQKRSWAE